MNPHSARTTILWALVGLVAYGSLFPFKFQAVDGDVWTLLGGFFSRWGSDGRLTDLLGNVALFVPLGLAAGYRRQGMVGRRTASLWTLLWLALFATALQVAQLWLPGRIAALSDVFWNLVGAAAGLLAARWLVGVRLRLRAHPAVMLLLAGWLLSQTAPLVPALGWQEFKDSLKPLLLHPEFDFGWYLLQTAMALAVARLLQSVPDLVAVPGRFALLLLAVLGLQLIVSHRVLELSVVLAFVSAWVVWQAWLRRQPAAENFIVVALLAAFTVHQLLPLEPASSLREFHWIPFAASLRGGLLNALINFSALLFLFGVVFWFLQQRSGRIGAAALAIAVWVLLLELAQTMLVGHIPDSTPAVLVLFAALAIGVLSAEGVGATAPERPKPTPAAEPARGDALAWPKKWKPVMLGAALALAMALAMQGLIELPGVPYNVRELFLGESMLFKLTFAVAILWVGAGSAWMAWRLAHGSAPWLELPVLLLVVATLCLLLLSMSVSDESLMDVVGASNMHWYITQREIWGAGMARALRALDMPALVAWIERLVRFVALVAPLLLMLALLGAAALRARRHRFTPGWWLLLWLAALPWFWLAKAVAFDWSSTDNLNELIARDAAWGMGGGFYLYLLLALFAANVIGLAGARMGRSLLVRAAATLLAVPLSWWLFKHGLDPAVHKYGQVFSGVQFLLGPDRVQALSTAALFGRWLVVYVGGVVVLAVSFALALQWLRAGAGSDRSRSSLRRPAAVSGVDASGAAR